MEKVLHDMMMGVGVHSPLTIYTSLKKCSGVPRLIDPEDLMIEPKPDQFSVMTYPSFSFSVRIEP